MPNRKTCRKKKSSKKDGITKEKRKRQRQQKLTEAILDLMSQQKHVSPLNVSKIEPVTEKHRKPKTRPTKSQKETDTGCVERWVERYERRRKRWEERFGKTLRQVRREIDREIRRS